MQITDSTLLASSSLITNKYAEIRKDAFLLNKDLHQHYSTFGWCKIEQAVTSSEIASFMAAYRKISTIEGFSIENQFLNTGCLVSPEIRDITSNVINTNVQTILPRIFDMHKVESHTGGSFVIKPPSAESELDVHQDSSFIDEERDYCFFMWVPFCDVNDQNGPLSVLPGSHLWGNTQRGFSVPWNLQKHSSLLRKHMHPVYAKTGDVILFDPALIHSSSANMSEDTRHAITITVARKNPKLIYYYKDDEKPSATIEKYYVNEDFFRTYDFASKPNEAIWKKEIIPYKSFDLPTDEVLSLINAYMPK